MRNSRDFLRFRDRRHFHCSWELLAVGLFLTMAAGCGNIAAHGRNAEGVRLFQQARYQEALQQFTEASYADPANPDAYYNLAATCHRLGSQQGERSYLDQAENFYNQCLDRHPNHRDCYRGLAVLLAEQDRQDEAFRLVQGWADRQPMLADPKIELARLCDEFGKKQQAKDHLVAALANEPNNARALAALGKIREEMGDHTQALADYRRSLYHDRFQPQVASRMAALQSQMGQTISTTPSNGTRLVERDGDPRR